MPDIREADLHDDVVKASVVTMVSVSKEGSGVVTS